MQDMLKYELKNSGDNDNKASSPKNQYITNETYVLKPKAVEDNIKEIKIVDECFKIISKVIKKKEDVVLDPHLFSHMVNIIEYL